MIKAMILTDEEMWGVIGETTMIDPKAVAKEQLKKLVDRWARYDVHIGCKQIPMGEWDALVKEIG